MRLGYRLPVFSIAFVMLAAIAVITPRDAGAETIKLVSGNLFPPYADQRLPEGGLATAIVRAVFARMGDRVEVEHMDWGEGYEMARVGHYLGTFPYIKSGDRKEHFYFSEALFTVRPHLFIHHGQAPFINELDDMVGKAICVPESWATDQYLRGLVKQGQISEVKGANIVDCFAKLHAQEVDGVSVDRQLGSMAASRVDSGAWTKARSFAPWPTPNYLIVSRSFPNGAQKLLEFNKTLQQLQNEGALKIVIQRFYDKYAS